jgi:hypothetical protein
LDVKAKFISHQLIYRVVGAEELVGAKNSSFSITVGVKNKNLN